jgi:putative ABC transport system permease protein
MARSLELRRATGAAAGSTLALALLVCGCVFAATAGPALSAHTQTQALHRTLAGLSATTKTVQVTANWSDFTGPLVQYGMGSEHNVSASELARTTRQIGAGLAALRLPLAAGHWASLASELYVVSGVGPRAQAGLPPKLEVVYRDPLTSNVQLTAGTYAGTAIPAGMLAVLATTATAARFSLHPGSRLSVATPAGPVALFVTAIVRPRVPASTFWAQDSTAGTPALQQLTARSIPFWVGGVFADPDQLTAMQDAFRGPGMELSWEFPLGSGGVTATGVRDLDDALNRAVTATVPLTGPLEPSANTLTVTSPLLPDLSLFLDTQAAIETVLLLLFVSLIVVGAAVILLAARMIVARRDVELTLLRARGGSLRQLAALMARTAVIATVPAALAGAGLAIVLIPGGAGAGAGWPLAGIAVAAGLAGPPLAAAWRHHRPAPALATAASAGTGRASMRAGPAWRRPVAEITACAAAVAGLVVLHDQGLPAGGRTNLYLTTVPVLVAIPVVVIMLRLYPLAVRGLLAISARRVGATGFVALSRAAQGSLTGLLPAFALVLALSLASFAGMLNDGITRSEVAASWQTTGAEVRISPGRYTPPVSSAAVRRIAAVRGVRHVTAVWDTTWATPFSQTVTVVAVDPISYAAVVADTPFPLVAAARIGRAAGGILSPSATVPVLASPSAAAILGAGAAQLDSPAAMGPIKVRVAGTLSGTPAQPGGGAFVVMPLQTLPGAGGQPLPNTVLVTGPAIDDAQLSAVAGQVIPGSVLTFRTTVLAALASSPLQHGAGLIIALTIATAAAFGVLIVITGLALESADRELTLARLTVMGHQRAVGLVLAEAMPAVLAAVVAGAVCAVALPHVVGSSIDLSAFTGTSAQVQFQPGTLAIARPAVIIVVLALAVLAAQARALRRRGVAGILRAQ